MTQRAKKPVAIANAVEAAIAELDALESRLREADERPWLKSECIDARARLAKAEETLARARQNVAIAEWDARDEPAVTKWVLTVPLDPGDRASFERAVEERIIEDAIRAYGYPEVWGYHLVPGKVVGKGKKKRKTPDVLNFRVEFSIEANERETWEYLEDIRDVVKSWVGFEYKFEEVTA